MFRKPAMFLIALCILVLFASCASARAGEDTQYVLYLGTNDKDTNLPVFSRDEAMAKVTEILINRFGGYTVQDAHGGWIDDNGTVYQEYTLIIYLSDTDIQAVRALADELLDVFRQRTVLIHTNLTTTEFYCGAN